MTDTEQRLIIGCLTLITGFAVLLAYELVKWGRGDYDDNQD